jgi:hypothetical protein
MVRILIGSLLGGVVQFLIGAIAWVGFGSFAYKFASPAAEADLHTALARTLTVTGDGTYVIPWPETAQGTTLLGQGPVAMVFFHAGGSSPFSPSAMLIGFVMSVLMLFVVGVALSRLDTPADRLRVLILFAAATIGYFVLALPVYNHFLPWTWWVFLAVEEFIAFVAGAYVLLRWFMPATTARTTLH